MLGHKKKLKHQAYKYSKSFHSCNKTLLKISRYALQNKQFRFSFDFITAASLLLVGFVIILTRRLLSYCLLLSDDD